MYKRQDTIDDVGIGTGTSYSLLEQTKNEKAKAEAAIANAEARYGGLGGDLRKRRDQRKINKGKYDNSKAAYVATALAGQAAIEGEYADDVETTTMAIDLFQDVFVGD